MEQLNVLLNAGHSPLSLARQMSRYLRNTLMAKLGGEQTELLQISADERARATRTALLFSEEELTRNLQIVLRTFDDLNYRQEQRFHLELGLLKLIHAQRLLPIEELLSGAGARPGTNLVSKASTGGSPQAGGRTASVSAVSSRTAIGFGSAVDMNQSVSAPQAASLAVPGFTQPSIVISQPASIPAFTPAAEEPARAATPANGAGIDAMREAVVSALSTAGHSSASLLLGSATWTLEGSTLRIEVPGIKKKMLELTVSAACEKIVRQELQRLGAPARFMVTPGEGVAAKAATGPVLAASVQEAALAHPMVKKAQEIFKADIRSVVDLRQK
jgi:DNA polymerase-3 subunit gamma/tau